MQDDVASAAREMFGKRYNAFDRMAPVFLTAESRSGMRRVRLNGTPNLMAGRKERRPISKSHTICSSMPRPGGVARRVLSESDAVDGSPTTANVMLAGRSEEM